LQRRKSWPGSETAPKATERQYSPESTPLARRVEQERDSDCQHKEITTATDSFRNMAFLRPFPAADNRMKQVPPPLTSPLPQDAFSNTNEPCSLSQSLRLSILRSPGQAHRIPSTLRHSILLLQRSVQKLQCNSQTLQQDLSNFKKKLATTPPQADFFANCRCFPYMQERKLTIPVRLYAFLRLKKSPLASCFSETTLNFLKSASYRRKNALEESPGLSPRITVKNSEQSLGKLHIPLVVTTKRRLDL